MTALVFPHTFVPWFRAVAPYIHAYRGETFVVGLAGEAIAAGKLTVLAQDLALMHAMGIRIVLVQNIGMVTIAALIGGGGFGAFVFQGIGQTAIDLVLLGAIPTVVLAFSAAVVLDALTDLTRRMPR